MLAVKPPLAPMLARLARELPRDGFFYEPKWDGFRCLAFRDGDEVDLRSRNQRPLARYFPEIVDALLELAEPGFALDGELVPATEDPAVALRWLEPQALIDGVVAKHTQLRYEPGRRVMVKVKLERTADCVVAGVRLLADRPLPSSLLLGLHDDAGALRHVGVAAGFSERYRRELLELLGPLVVPLAGHPWEHGFLVGGGATGRLPGAAGAWRPGEMEQDWTPLEPRLVAEVSYDRLDGERFRHPARFRRWRADREPSSCTLDQLR